MAGPDLVPLSECPPGLFRFDRVLCFKSEYRTESLSRPGVWQDDAYVVESGEYFWGGTSDPAERQRLLVVPLAAFNCAACQEIFLMPRRDREADNAAR